MLLAAPAPALAPEPERSAVDGGPALGASAAGEASPGAEALGSAAAAWEAAPVMWEGALLGESDAGAVAGARAWGGEDAVAGGPVLLSQAPADKGPSDSAPSDKAMEDELPLEPLVEEYDPWEPFNEAMFAFNLRLDRYVVKPIARAWNFVLPDEIQRMIGRVIDNARSVPRIVNNVLQGKFEGAGRETARLLINSVVGIGGLWDMAKQEWGILRSEEDFGQTLGVAGSGPGPYLVLPFLAPLSVRDGVGRVVDIFLDPLTYLLPLGASVGVTATERVNDRALNLELFEGFEETTLDLYSAVRNAYLARRKRQVSD
jgi:phospholipid-binding lipoprotein MlaA